MNVRLVTVLHGRLGERYAGHMILGWIHESRDAALLSERATSMPSSTTSEDEFDRLPDPFAGIDWNDVPGLSAITPSQPSAEPRHSTPSHSQTSVSDQYSYDELDAAFLAEIDQVERRLLPPQVAGSGGSSSHAADGDRRPETPTLSNALSKLTSRFFHGKNIFHYGWIITGLPLTRQQQLTALQAHKVRNEYILLVLLT
jgi:hypothetical protein